jgi:hypothetical protein
VREQFGDLDDVAASHRFPTSGLEFGSGDGEVPVLGVVLPGVDFIKQFRLALTEKTRVARRYIFIPKLPYFDSLRMENVGRFLAIW